MCNCVECPVASGQDCVLCPPVDVGEVCVQHETRIHAECGRPEHVGDCRQQWDEPAYYEHKHSFSCDPGGGVYPGARCSGGMNCPIRWPVPRLVAP